MAIGHLAYIVECQSSGALSASVAPCADIGGNFYQPVVIQAYVLDTTAPQYLDGIDEPFDYSTAAAFWAWGFIGVATFWLIGLVCSKIVAPLWNAR